ncbi:hypothetical protein BK139_18865 [Paenibacillus sp. FSL R5-0490]|uniref:CBO0543 family protein n=1 Tax=Bacillales TaxID=1385 RepID=UPI00096C4D52|nr:CBO0543 family protein [Paenibacillus sp. FSL R5-0490]OMF54236.1 hypothetical protein BK139_18865 [Paenibacillus sp. FSL R5-0490]
MYLLLVVLVYVFFAWKFVDWKRWKEYYPTVQFYIIANFLYNFLFYNHTLWAYRAVTLDWLNHTFIEITFTLLIIPVVVMIYLRYFPEKNLKKKIFYIGVWIVYFSVLEYLFSKKGLFVYDNGWNFWWSVLFNLIMFIMLRMHYKKPGIAMAVSLPIIAILLWFFHPHLIDLK